MSPDIDGDAVRYLDEVRSADEQRLFAQAAAPEVVVDGESGFVVDDEDAMVAAAGDTAELALRDVVN